MKVLFAVSNEEISESIVRKYQKEYKEIISYKNVYYFNAILKELQKDKSYDRIVISEDLESFSHTQYEQIDKFIFDRLDSISDEATNLNGEDIPIIIICADRRTKSEPMLSKLFGIGIYNALLGNDRSVEQVCKLINKPRVKRDAKTYYKIESEEVTYKPESENDVSEVEIQNILAHFKRLGKNEDKYVESFDSIAEQYNDAQLKVICKFLPLNVRATLEEKSPRYQKLVSYNKSVSNSLRNRDKVEDADTGTTEKLLKPKTNEAIMKKPVVIPSSVNMSGKKKLAKKPATINNEEFTENDNHKIEELKENRNTIDNQKMNNNRTNRLGEKANQHMEDIGSILEEIQPTVKNEVIEPKSEYEEIEETPVKPVKRGRGRPRKQPVEETQTEEKPKRGRGRPRKNVAVEQNVTLPGFDNEEENHQKTISQDSKNEFEDDEMVIPGFDEIENQPVQNTNAQNTYKNQIQEDDDYILPGFDEEDDKYEEVEDKNILPGFDEESARYEPVEEDSPMLPFDEDEENDYENTRNKEIIMPGLNSIEESENNLSSQRYEEITPAYQYQNEGRYESARENATRKDEEERAIDIASLLTASSKLACFVGTSKNGTSFIVNNIAKILASRGVDVAILDTTKNRNSYYIYTKNEEDLRELSTQCIENLIKGYAKGIQVEKNLTVYTALEDERYLIENSGQILQTLAKSHTVVLVDCDFETPINYFRQAQEIYLIQSLDVLTIQPLTAFLRDLKSKNILEERKLRIVLNKVVKVRGVNEKTIIGGMAFYNDPSMSFMTELFDRNLIKYISIPFDEDVYASYLGALIDCNITLKGYPKNIMQSLQELASMIYPSPSGKSTYKPPTLTTNNGFSASINSTLDQMKKY